MNTACRYGCFWFFRLQPMFEANETQRQLTHWDKAEQITPIPWWIVRRFQAHVKEGFLTRLEPLEWAPVLSDTATNAQDQSNLPHPDVVRVLYDLSILRGKEFLGKAACAPTEPPKACTRCRTKGHTAGNCPEVLPENEPRQHQAAPKQQAISRQQSGVVCYHCWVEGHYRNKCVKDLTRQEFEQRKAVHEQQYGPVKAEYHGKRSEHGDSWRSGSGTT